MTVHAHSRPCTHTHAQVGVTESQLRSSVEEVGAVLRLDQAKAAKLVMRNTTLVGARGWEGGEGQRAAWLGSQWGGP